MSEPEEQFDRDGIPLAFCYKCEHYIQPSEPYFAPEVNGRDLRQHVACPDGSARADDSSITATARAILRGSYMGGTHTDNVKAMARLWLMKDDILSAVGFAANNEIGSTYADLEAAICTLEVKP